MKMFRVVLLLGLLVLILFLGYLPTAIAQGSEEAGKAGGDPESTKWAYVAAAISVGTACLGAGLAVGYVGSAAVGGVAEKPEIAGRALIFVGLAEGIAIYGLIIAIMILGKV